jgi:hypothetical protein
MSVTRLDGTLMPQGHTDKNAQGSKEFQVFVDRSPMESFAGQTFETVGAAADEVRRYFRGR